MECFTARGGLRYIFDYSGISHALPPDQIFERVAPSVWSVNAYGADGSSSLARAAWSSRRASCHELPGAGAGARGHSCAAGSEIHGARLEFPDTERIVPVRRPRVVRTRSPWRRSLRAPCAQASASTLSIQHWRRSVNRRGTRLRAVRTPAHTRSEFRPRCRQCAGCWVRVCRPRGSPSRSSDLFTEGSGRDAFAGPGRTGWRNSRRAGQAALAARAKAAKARTGIHRSGQPVGLRVTDRLYGRPQIDVTVSVTRVDGSSIDECVSSRGSGQKETQPPSGQAMPVPCMSRKTAPS